MDVWQGTKHLTLAALATPDGFFRFGRPGYYAYLNSPSDSKPTTAMEVMKRLTTNLLSGKVDQYLTLEQALAILGVRVALTVTASSHVARTLTASHMRLCVGILEDRQSLFTYQYAEPALAFAAMSLTHDHGWLILLDRLREAMSATYIHAGHRGEIGAQLLLLMASDRCTVDTGIGYARNYMTSQTMIDLTIPTIPLSKFLSILTGMDSHIAIDNFSDRISNMYVRLIQFVQVFAKPGKKQICEMFRRAAGIVVKPGSEQVDLIIPLLVHKERNRLHEVVPVPEQMSALLIQVKCFGSSRTIEKDTSVCSLNLLRNVATENASFSDRLNKKLDYLSLLMEVGSHAASRSSVRVFSREDVGADADPKQLSIAINGLRPNVVLHQDIPHLDQITSSFDELMIAGYNPAKISSSSNEAIRNLKLSLDLVYKS